MVVNPIKVELIKYCILKVGKILVLQNFVGLLSKGKQFKI